MNKSFEISRKYPQTNMTRQAVRLKRDKISKNSRKT